MLTLDDSLKHLQAAYRPVVAYILNAIMEEDKLAERIRWFKHIGYGGILLIAGGGKPFYRFMDDEWIEAFGIIMRLAKENGLDVWIFDEWGYPTGPGGGLVTQDPNLRARKLHLAFDLLLEPEQALELTAPERVVSAGAVPVNKYAYYTPAGAWKSIPAIPGERLAYTAGNTRERFLLVTWEYFSFHQQMALPNNPDDASICTADMLNPKAARRLTEVIHERYREKLEPYFGNVFKGFFYDEPEMAFAFPWTGDFATEFQTRKGYDIRPHLPLLMAYLPMAYMGLGAEPKVARDLYEIGRDYFDVWTDLAAQNFYGELEHWCHQHGILSIGHQDMDNKMNTLASVSGHFFKNNMHNDHPGIDVIWEQIAPGRFDDFPRYAGSSARLFGKPRALSETLAEMGAGMHADSTRYVLEHQIVRGVTQFFMMTSDYQTNKKAPPHNHFELIPFNEVMDAFGKDLHERIGRISSLMNVGISSLETGLMVPMSDIYLEQARLGHPHTRNTAPAPWESAVEIARHLAYLPVEFDYLWEDALFELELVEGGFRTQGGHVIRTLILPPRTQLRTVTLEPLYSFHQHGGKILVLEEPNAPLEGWSALCPAMEDLDQHLSRRLTLKPEGTQIALASRLDGEGEQQREIILLLNEEKKARWVELVFNGGGRLLEIDPQNGVLSLLEQGKSLSFQTTFAPTALKAFILDRSGTMKAPRAAQPGEKSITLENWFLKPPRGKEIKITGKFPGWDEIEYPNYSGWMTYTARFSWQFPTGDALLDLGEVCYGAEIQLDGGAKIRAPFQPYRVVLKDLEQGGHYLQIRVLNSPANSVCGTLEREKKLFGDLPNPLLVPDRRKLRSGLFGPVTIAPLVPPMIKE